MSKQENQNIQVTTNKESKKPSLLTHPVLEIEKAFDRLFDARWPSLWRTREFPTFDSLFEFSEKRIPNLDVVDREDELIVRAEVPGIEKKDISISVADNILTIKGQTSREQKEEKGDFYKREISSSSIARSILLPSSVDESKADASLKDGILEVKLPKVQSSKRREIAVK